jgi:phosphate-selective porin OprO and OprP
MRRKSVLLAGTALAAFVTTSALAQPSRSLEDRVRALEQSLGQTNAAPGRSLEERVQALEAQIQQRVTEDEARAQTLSAVETELEQKKAEDEAEAQRLMALETQLEEKEEDALTIRTRLATLEQMNADASWIYDFNRATIRTADNRFQLAFRGRFQFDSGLFFQDHDLSPEVAVGRDLRNGANFRRAQIGVEGRVYRDFNYEFVFDFGSSGTERSGQIYLLRVAYTGIPFFTINAGAIQPKFTLDDSTSSAEITFLERASIINALLDPFGGSDSRRGVELIYQRSDLFKGGDNLLISTAFTGERIANVKTDDEGSQLTGRIAYRFHSDERSNYQIGFDGARILNKPNGLLSFGDRPETRVDGTQLVGFGFPGLQSAVQAKTGWLYGAEAAMNYGPLYLSGEYYRYRLDRTDPSLKDPEFGGWYLQASYFLTGEARPYLPASAAWGSPAVVSPFALDSGSWGSWEIKARYSNNDFNALIGDPLAANSVFGGEQNIITLGANWYLNRNLRWMFDYLIVDVDRQNSSGQQVGQDFSAFVNRLQFSF